MEARVLGPVEVRDVGGEVLPLAPRLQRVVAALAVVAPGSASVENLMDAVWGKVAPPTAGKALQGLVSSLRATCGATFVETVDGGYRLGPAVQLDRARFDELANRVLVAGGGEPADVDDALGLWRGRPFPGLDTPAVAAEAARLEEIRHQLEETRVSTLVGSSPGVAVAALERMVEDTPLRERRWSLLVEALVADGRVAEALRAYERARRRLAEEVGVAPGPDLAAAYRTALDAPSGTSEERVTDLGWVRPPPPLPFVGRAALAAGLANRCREIESLGAVVLAGEPGMGKTRLMEEVALDVAGDAAVLFGACDPGVRDGLGALRPAVSRLVGLVGDEALERLDVPTLEDLGRIVPGLIDRLGLSVPRPVDPETDQARLRDAVVAIVRIVTRAGPTLLVLDDLHWADDEAVGLMGRVLGGLRDEPLLVLAGHRHLEPDRNAALVDWLDSVATQGRVEQVALEGLSASELRLLLDRLGGPSGPNPERLWAATAGNPFFVGQVLSVGEEAGPTEAVQAVVERHLAAIDEEATELLRAGAVAGRRFRLRHAATLAGVAPRAIVPAIEAGLVDRGDHDDEHAFHHDLIRDVILAGMTPVDREDLHWAIAGLPDLAPRDAADHAVAGATTVGRRMEAARIAVAGGEDALRLLLYTEAVHRFDDALGLLDDRPDPVTMTRARIGRSRARYLAGDAQGSYTDAAQAVRISRPQSASLFADAVLALAGTPEDLNLGEHRAEDDCREALDRIPRDDVTRRARLLAVAAIHRWDRAGGHADVDHEFEEALALSRAAGDGPTEAFVLRARQRAWFAAVALDERLAAAARLVSIGSETGDDAIRCWGRRWQVIHGFEALTPAQRNALDRFGALADALGDVFHLWGHRLRSAGLALAEGRSDDADRLADDARAHARRLGSSLPVEAGDHLDRARRWLWGDPEALVNVHPTGHAVEAPPEGGSGPLGAHARALLVLSGDAEAAEWAREHEAKSPTLVTLRTHNAFELDGLAWQAAACGDGGLAASLVTVLEPLGRQWASVLPGLTALTPLASSLGLALEVLGRDDEAILAHREAVEVAEEAGAWPAAVHALAHLGRVEARLGDPEVATTTSRADDLAADLGSAAHEMIRVWALPVRGRL